MSKPTISILMPVHNGFPFLPETVESIFKQTFTDFELIAIDDGSTDESTNYLKGLTDPRVKYLRQEKVGLVGALNHGNSHAQAELIARIDADDVATPDRLAKQLEYMNSHPKCVLLGCDFDEMDVNGKYLNPNTYKMTSDAGLKFQLFFCTPFLHPGVLMRKANLDAVGGYRKVYNLAEDYDLWTRLTTQGEIAALPDMLMHKRIHSNAVSVVHRDKGLEQSSEIAADYAERNSGMNRAAASELYWFFQLGQPPTRCSLSEMVTQFQKTVALFPGSSGNEDLKKSIEYTRRRLRWFAAAQVKKHLLAPWKAWAWLRSMSAFDPENGTLLSVLTRRLKSKSLPSEHAVNTATS